MLQLSICMHVYNMYTQTPKLSCGADTSDLSEVIQHIHSSVPHSRMMAVGTSMGRYVLYHVMVGLHSNIGLTETKTKKHMKIYQTSIW